MMGESTLEHDAELLAASSVATARPPETAEAASIAGVGAPRRRSRWTPVAVREEPSAEERAAERRAARLSFRAYCIACGRSTESATAPRQPGRCSHCGGTMLVERIVS